MSYFNFKYEKLLKLKKELEDEAKNDLAVEIQKSIKIKEAIKGNLQNQKAYLKDLNQRMKSGIKASELKQLNNNKGYYNERNKALNQQLRNQQLKIIEKRKALNKAVQETKKFEKIREKHYEAFIKEFYAAERKQLDEIVNYKNFKMSGDDNGK